MATFRQQALALAVSDAIAAAMQDRLTMEPIAPASTLVHNKARSTAEAEASRLRDRADQAQTEAERAEAKSRGAREMASLLVADGEIARARQYERDAAEGDTHAALLRAEADRLVAKAARAALSADAQAMADVTAIAYLIAGLREAASTGKVIDEVGQVADRMLRDWTLVPVENEDARGGKWITFTVNLVVPLVGRPDELVVPLTGQVPNVRRPRKSPSTITTVDVVRTAWNPRGREHACELFFRDGKTLDEVALWTRIPVKSVLANHLPVWLRDHGIRSSSLKAALIDHPFASVRQVIFEAVTGQPGRVDLSGHGRAWRDHVVSVYLDPVLNWGCAACPDDLFLEHAVMDHLAANGTTSRCEIHAEFGISMVRSRQLVTPGPRTPKRGVARPQYVAWGDPGKKSLSLISCPHDDCTGVAARAVLLPETAVSGFGALCTTCRRLPNLEDPKWGSIVFPEEYINTRWTSGPRNPRPLTGRTVALAGDAECP